MGILSNLLGSTKVVSAVANTLEKGTNMLDNAFYTDQEKAAAAQKQFDSWLKLQDSLASENSIRSVTRRYLAWLIMGTFTLLIIFAAGVYKIDKDWAEYILALLSSTRLGELAIGVGIFYFGVQLFRNK